MAKLTVSGLNELKKTLRRLAGGKGEAIVRGALHDAAKPFTDAVESGSPGSDVRVRDVRASEDGSIAVQVEISDDATPPQRRAVSRAYRSTKPAVRQLGEREILDGIRREAAK